MEQFEQNEVGESTVDIKEYFYLFRSWGWLIALAGLLAGGAALLVSMRMVPVYEASTKLLVSAPSNISGVDAASLVTTQTMTSTYADMLVDRPVLEGVIEMLHLPTTAETLKKSISVEVVANTQLMKISAKDHSPKRAAEIANAMGTVFVARIRELQSERYAASREGLAAQVSDMEQQMAMTTEQIAALEQRAAVSATQAAEVAASSTPALLPPPVMTDPAELVQLQARLTQYRAIYSSLVTSYEQVRLSEAQTSTNVIVSEPAAQPIDPVSPKTLLNTLLAAVAGIVLAGGGVLAADALDDTFRDPDDLRKKYGLSILGMIAWHETPEDRAVALAEPRSPAAEAFRALRTNITYASVDKPLRRILVTSPTPKDGKTTVAANLAAVLSQGEKKVVLVDGDLRRPQVHHKFGLPNRVGLTELFVWPLETIASAIHPVSGLPKLGVITSGGLPPNPAELLSSRTMTKILDKLNQVFDMIVVDTPPLLSVTDAAALAPGMNGVILVVKPGVTKSSAVQQAVEQLRAVKACILGVVLNEVNPTSRKYGYYYSRYHSDYARYYGRQAATKAITAPRDQVDAAWEEPEAKPGVPAGKTRNG